MNDYKTCTKCCQTKSITEFSKDKQRKDGYYPHCKICQKKKMDRWYNINKDKVYQYQKTYNIENMDKVKEYRCKTKSHRSTYMKRWRINNKDSIKIYKNKYHNEIESKQIEYRILHSLRGRLLQALKSIIKSKHTMELVGCSMDDLKKHLSSKFKDGMNWDNYGRKGWHIDHITPCASFDLTKLEEQQKCFHYTNLQPLWWLDNLRKNKY